MDPHVALVTVLTLCIGFVMTLAGLQKSALEWRRRYRVCPSCGRAIDARICRTCAS